MMVQYRFYLPKNNQFEQKSKKYDHRIKIRQEKQARSPKNMQYPKRTYREIKANKQLGPQQTLVAWSRCIVKVSVLCFSRIHHKIQNLIDYRV